MTDDRREILIQAIRDAFAHVPFPGADNLTDSTCGEEPAALIEEFSEKTDWSALDDRFLDEAPQGWASAISFFSGAALHFYLPAYLIADLRDSLYRCDPAYRLCAFVTPQTQDQKISKTFGNGTLGEYACDAFARFSAEQVSVIVAYLRWKLDREGYNPTIEQALDNYWLARQEL